MPGDGWLQVLRVLKVDERTTAIPVAMFSIKMEVRDRLHGLQEGAFDLHPSRFPQRSCSSGVRRIFSRRLEKGVSVESGR